MQNDLGPGMLALGRGDVEGAITDFETTLRHDPDNHAVRMLLGFTHFRAAHFPAAVEAFWSVLERDPALTAPQAPTEAELDDALGDALFAWANAARDTGSLAQALLPWLARYRARFKRRQEDLLAAEAALRS